MLLCSLFLNVLTVKGKKRNHCDYGKDKKQPGQDESHNAVDCTVGELL